MEAVAATIINELQNGFPLAERPFAEAASRLGMEETALIAGIEGLLKSGHLSRFGPLFNAERMGGGLTLAALAVTEKDYDRVTEIVNAFPEVAHNYAREHTLNMWFVAATETRREMPAVLAEIERRSGYPVFNLPKLAEYRLGFFLHIGANGIDTVPLRPETATGIDAVPDREPDEVDRAMVAATQDGLPLLEQPYRQVAERVGVAVDEILERFGQMLRWGWVRRFGVVPNHYRLGLKGNGMTVWELTEEKIDELGERVGGLDAVSHCYRRPRHLPEWPYNLFAMVHGPDRSAVAAKAAAIKTLLGADVGRHELLYSTRILKKTGLRLRK